NLRGQWHEFAMSTNEARDIRTLGNDAQLLLARVFQCGANQFFRDTASPKLGGDERVREHDLAVALNVFGNAQMPVDRRFKSALGRVVLNRNCLLVGLIHEAKTLATTLCIEVEITSD